MPSYYSIVGGYIVFIYTDVDQFLKGDHIKDEISALITDRRLLLDSLVLIDDSPTLKTSTCEGRVLTERDVDVIELPCYLRITAENGQLKLVRKN